MAEGGQNRLALTAFAEPIGLWRTIGTLLDAGVPIEHLCLVGPAASMARFTPSTTMSDGHLGPLTALHQRAREWWGSTGDPLIVTTSEALLDLALQAGAADRRALGAMRASQKTPLDLESDLRRDLVTLIVRSSDAHQQLLATRCLLANAQHRVMTYEQVAPVEARRSD